MFPLNDQEIMIRHLHHAVSEQVAAYQRGNAGSGGGPMSAPRGEYDNV